MGTLDVVLVPWRPARLEDCPSPGPIPWWSQEESGMDKSEWLWQERGRKIKAIQCVAVECKRRKGFLSMKAYTEKILIMPAYRKHN